MYKLWVYPASHEERPNKGTGIHEEHASQHRPTTHPPLGVPLHPVIQKPKYSQQKGIPLDYSSTRLKFLALGEVNKCHS